MQKLSKKLLLLSFLITAHPVLAESNNNQGQISFQILNDVIFQTDKDYTNGVIFLWTPRGSPITYRAGQDMYTPTQLSVKEPIKGEHPYAGWAYIGFEYRYKLSNNLISSFIFDAGTTGPRSGADETQKLVHKMTDAQHPEGWDSQVYNQWGYMPQLQLNYRIPFISSNPSSTDNFLKTRTESYIRARGGNIINDYGVGFNLFLGNDIPAFRENQISFDKSFYIFLRANVEYRYVDKNIILEGNTKKEDGKTVHSYGVVPENEVIFGTLGLVVGYRSYQLGFDVTYSSATYTTQVFDTEGLTEYTGLEFPDGDYISSLTIKRFY